MRNYPVRGVAASANSEAITVIYTHRALQRVAAGSLTPIRDQREERHRELGHPPAEVLYYAAARRPVRMRRPTRCLLALTPGPRHLDSSWTPAERTALHPLQAQGRASGARTHSHERGRAALLVSSGSDRLHQEKHFACKPLYRLLQGKVCIRGLVQYPTRCTLSFGP